MRSFIFFFTLSFLPVVIIAQEVEEPEYPLSKHALGASASTFSGPGISYQYIFNEDHRMKLTGFAYYIKEKADNTDLVTFVGLEYQRNFFTTDSRRFYGLVGGYYGYSK